MLATMREKIAYFVLHTLRNRKLAKILYFGFPLYWRCEVYSRLTENYVYRHKAVLDYLHTRYKEIIDKYRNDATLAAPTEVLSPDCPVWVFWYQGEKQMPDIVRACVASIRRHRGQHPVYVLDKESYTAHVRFSDTIIRKVENGQIRLAHFSDLLRNRLLTQYGGFWMDATLYQTGDYWQGAKIPYFTLKTHSPWLQTYFIAGSHWATFLQGGVKANPLNRLVSEMMEAYFEKEFYAIDYFLQDYCIYIGYTEVPAITQMMDAVPYSNENWFYLTSHLAQKTNQEELDSVLRTTHIFKMSYKHDYSVLKGDDLLYHRLLRGEVE